MPHRCRSALLVFALAAPLACTGRTAPLESLGVNSGGDAGLTDGSVLDTGVLDAGDPGPVDGGPSGGCTYAGRYQQMLSLSSPGGGLPFSAYSGLATVLGVDPLELGLNRGSSVRIALGDAVLPEDLQTGRVVWLQYGTDTPQWTNTALAISDVAPNDGPGRLRFVAWAYGDEEVDFDEFEDIELFYETDDCTPAPSACGPARTESLVLKAPGVETRVGAAEVQRFRTLQIGNGRSHRFAPAPECTDTPTFWHEGYLSVF